MKILLLNLYYPPDTSATAKMAQTVVDAICIDHRVTVLCGRPSYDPTERRAWRPYQTENVGLIRIIRAGSTAFPRFSMKKRLLSYLSYLCLAVPRALLIDYFPSAKTSSALAAADAHIVTIVAWKAWLYPARCTGILAAGKPIVAVAPKETDVVSLGAKQGFAVAADPDKPGGPGERCSRFDCGRQKDESHGRSGAGCCAFL